MDGGVDGGMDGRMDAGWTVPRKTLTEGGRDCPGKWTVSGQKRKIYCKIILFKSLQFTITSINNS